MLNSADEDRVDGAAEDHDILEFHGCKCNTRRIVDFLGGAGRLDLRPALRRRCPPSILPACLKPPADARTTIACVNSPTTPGTRASPNAWEYRVRRQGVGCGGECRTWSLSMCSTLTPANSEPRSSGLRIAFACCWLSCACCSASSGSVVADSGGANVNGAVDALLGLGRLRRVLAQVEVDFSNSMIEAFWRSMKHNWLFLNQLDTPAAVEHLVAFYVTEHNSVMPHAAFNGQTPDEVYFGTGDQVAAQLAQRRTEARQARLAANRMVACAQCLTDAPWPESSTISDVVRAHPQKSQMS